MKALRSVRNKRFHEAVFHEHCLHQATKLGISIYEASRNGIYLQSIDAEGLVAVLNHRVHGNAGITGKRVFVAGSGIGALVLASAVLGAKSAIGIESMDKIFDTATKFHDARKCLGLQNVCNLGFTSFAQMHSLPHDPSVLFAFMKNISLEEWVSMLYLISKTRTLRVLMLTDSIHGSNAEVLVRLNEQCSGSLTDIWIYVETLSVGGRENASIFRFSGARTHNSEPRAYISFPTDLLVSKLIMQGAKSSVLTRFDTDSEGPTSKEMLQSSDYVFIGNALQDQGFSKVRLLGAGTFGNVAAMEFNGRSCVVKFSTRTTSQGPIKNHLQDSIFRDAFAGNSLNKKRSAHNQTPVPVCAFGNGTASLGILQLPNQNTISLLVMEQCTSDCLDLFQQNSKHWAKTAEMTDEALVLLLMIAKALLVVHYMHGEGWAHGDLKPENILLFWDEAGRKKVRLTDLGNAQTSELQYNTRAKPEIKVVPGASRRAKKLHVFAQDGPSVTGLSRGGKLARRP